MAAAAPARALAPAQIVEEAEPKTESPPGFLSRIAWFTILLCGVLIFEFNSELRLATDFSGPSAPGHFSLLAAGGSSRTQVWDHGEWWRLFTSTALHGSPDHLIGNLIALAAAGFLLEPIVGLGWFAAVYFIGGLSGAILSTILNPADLQSVGASGAIMACLATTFCLSFHAGARSPRLMRRVAGVLLFPAMIPSVSDGGAITDLSAHLGGFVAGMVMAFAILIAWPDEDDRLPGRSFAALLAGGLLALTVWAFVQSANSYDKYAQKGFDFIPAADMPATEDAMRAQSYQLVDKYPKDPRAHFFRGLYFLEQNDLNDAEPHLREAIKLGEQNPGVMGPRFLTWSKAMLALDVHGLGRPDEARTIAAPVCGAEATEEVEMLKKNNLCPG